MKFRIFLICTLLVTFSVAAGLAGQTKSGSYTKTSTTKKDVVEAATFAVMAQEQAMLANGEQPGKVQLIKILGAEEQVVAGINYRLKLKVEIDGKQKLVQAVVWWQAWRKPDPYKLTSWK